MSTSDMSRNSIMGSVILKVSLSDALQNSLGKKPNLPRIPPHHHNQKDGQRGIQAENQIFHTKFPPCKQKQALYGPVVLWYHEVAGFATVWPGRSIFVYVSPKNSSQALTKQGQACYNKLLCQTAQIFPCPLHGQRAIRPKIDIRIGYHPPTSMRRLPPLW